MTDQAYGKLRTVLNKIVTHLSFLGSIWVVILMLLIMADVIGRGFFNSPIDGVPEIVKNSIVGITFLQITHVLAKNRHIRTTALYDRVPDRYKRVMDLIASLAGIAVFSMIFYSTLEAAYRAFVTGDFEGNNVRIPTFPTHLLILLGSLLMVIQFAINGYDAIRGQKENEHKGGKIVA